MEECAAEYFRHESPGNGVQYFMVGGLQQSRLAAQQNQVAHKRNTEIVEGPRKSLLQVLGEGDIYELLGRPIPEERVATDK